VTLADRVRIVHVVNRLDTGGTELTLLRLCAALDPLRFENVICTVEPGGLDTENGGARIVCLNRRPAKGRVLIAQFAKLFAAERPDVVHSRSWGAIEAVLAARISGAGRAKVIHSEHGRDVQTMRTLPVRNKLLRRICYSCADFVFAVSTELRDFYAKQVRMPSSRIGVIRNGIDTEHFRPDATARNCLRSAVSLRPETIAVGCVGRLDPIKDHATLLRAADIVISQGADIKLYIVGDGCERPTLEALVRSRSRLAGRVVFTGNVRNVSQWLNGFDIFVLPSLSEGMSNTIVEGMAVGLPIIATAAAGQELVEDQTSGLLVPEKDEGAMAKSLNLLIADKSLRTTLGNNARLRAQSAFSMQRMVEEYTRMYTRSSR
jgi:sugar transferase (PEP-CTERM/EpsH1 system associated)